ncbi:TfuA-like protein [Sorangium sp. So ce1153]|uniref:TfuA-like protein n=1 Tax=Sorangium sp. So ce1153 TaxID=3133333 RepID=UPI003F6225CB
MKIYVFTGPTISAEEARVYLDATYLPPVAQGDVYRGALERPVAIGIVDGLFQRVPAVWHKEILWAMAQGIHVFGSASMGALRAAELAAFGMEGIGAIYEAFARGELEDDDEVAVAHGAAEHGYRAVSEAMVNIRSTLRAAAAAGVIDDGLRDGLAQIAKDVFYAERTWSLVLARGLDAGVPSEAIEALRGFLPRGRVNQKRLDAIAMLERMRARTVQGIEPKAVRYRFQHTNVWEHAVRTAGRLSVSSSPATPAEGAVSHEALAEELQLSAAYAAAWRGAMSRALALELARQRNASIGEHGLESAVEAFCVERGLHDELERSRWAREHDVRDLERFFLDEARVRWAEATLEVDAREVLPDSLRAEGRYAALAARASDKQRVLAARGALAPSLADVGLSEAELLRWYFEERLGQPIPRDVAAYARAAGFADVDSLRRALLREASYLRWTEKPPAHAGGA